MNKTDNLLHVLALLERHEMGVLVSFKVFSLELVRNMRQSHSKQIFKFGYTHKKYYIIYYYKVRIAT
jgi:hypothetical protein